MSQRFIDGTALLSIEWTVQKLDNVDRTHLVLLSSTTKNLYVDFQVLVPALIRLAPDHLRLGPGLDRRTPGSRHLDVPRGLERHLGRRSRSSHPIRP